MTGVVFTVGNDMRGDDGAGPLLARLLEEQSAQGWTVVDGESSPENHLHWVRAQAPERVLIVDAADMGEAPGTVRLIDEDCVAEQFLITTHALPLNFLIASLRESIADIVFLGIQPLQTEFLVPMTDAVREGVEALHRALVAGVDIATFGRPGGDPGED
jgi:hydrogenase 3 maturation protease